MIVKFFYIFECSRAGFCYSRKGNLQIQMNVIYSAYFEIIFVFLILCVFVFFYFFLHTAPGSRSYVLQYDRALSAYVPDPGQDAVQYSSSGISSALAVA